MKKYLLTAFAAAVLPLTLAACKGKDAVVIENETPNFSVSSGTLLSEESPAEAESSVLPVASGESMFIVVTDAADATSSAGQAESAEPGETVSADTESGTGAETDGGAVGGSPDHVVVNGGSIVLMAQSLIGKPFTDGGDNPEAGFDNSGFIYYVLRANGYINCPRQSSEQTEIGQKISAVSKLAPGDLVFFGSGGKADFGGIYIGDGQMIYSPMPGQTVKQVDMASEYWRDAFVFGIDLRN